MEIKKVGIVGGGKMSAEIFKLLVEKDVALALWTPFANEAAAAEEELLKKLRRRQKKGGEQGAEADKRLSQLSISTDMSTLADADLIIEAIVESLGPKRKVFAELDKVVKPDAIFTTNTSSLSPTSMAAVTQRKPSFAGLHFFYPVSLMSFVEVIPCKETSPEVTQALMDFVRMAGKRPILIKREMSAYLVNRILASYYNEGAGIAGEGYYLPGQIDKVARRFAMMGPCESIDHVGVDVFLHGWESADESWGEENHIVKGSRGFEPWPTIYAQLRADGRLGRKNGKGLYLYDGVKPIEDPDYFQAIWPTLYNFHRYPPFSEEVLEQRLHYAIILESLLVWERGVADKEDIETTMKEILGLEKGPFAYIESVGLEEAQRVAEALGNAYGPRLAPVSILKR